MFQQKAKTLIYSSSSNPKRYPRFRKYRGHPRPDPVEYVPDVHRLQEPASRAPASTVLQQRPHWQDRR